MVQIMKNNISVEEFVSTAKALSDPNRVSALMALRLGELCVCQIMELLNLAGSTVSKHMSILKNAGLVTSRKEGRWVYYSISEQKSEFINDILEITTNSLQNCDQIARETERLKEIKQQSLESLCRSQRGANCCP